MGRVLEIVLHSPCRTKAGRPAPFPCMNDYVHACRHSKYAGGKMEKKWREWVEAKAREAARAQGWEAPDGKVRLSMTWREARANRDQDGIRWFEKPLLDGLKDAGVIRDDSQRCVDGMSRHELAFSRSDPGVTVRVEAVDG